MFKLIPRSFDKVIEGEIVAPEIIERMRLTDYDLDMDWNDNIATKHKQSAYKYE